MFFFFVFSPGHWPDGDLQRHPSSDRERSYVQSSPDEHRLQLHRALQPNRPHHLSCNRTGDHPADVGSGLDVWRVDRGHLPPVLHLFRIACAGRDRPYAVRSSQLPGSEGSCRRIPTADVTCVNKCKPGLLAAPVYTFHLFLCYFCQFSLYYETSFHIGEGVMVFYRLCHCEGG